MKKPSELEKNNQIFSVKLRKQMRFCVYGSLAPGTVDEVSNENLGLFLAHRN